MRFPKIYMNKGNFGIFKFGVTKYFCGDTRKIFLLAASTVAQVFN